MRLENASVMPDGTEHCTTIEEVVAIERDRLDDMTRPFSAPRTSPFWAPLAKSLEGKK